MEFSGKERKRSYDPIDYESIDKVDFWIVEEEPSGELDADELDELIEENFASIDNILPSNGIVLCSSFNYMVS